jgi:hypothetical protein
MACSVIPVNGFGKLWRENGAVRSKLACPSAPEISVTPAAEQHFQGGYMFWRGDTHTIYVFIGTQPGHWYQFADNWQETDPTPVIDTPPPGLHVPVRGFGKIWSTYSGLRQSLGWATDVETNITAAWEGFSGGSMMWTADRTIRVLYDDLEHTVDVFQDTFVTPTSQAIHKNNP